MTKYFTSESVSAGHPDKIADQIADAILDAVLEQDPHARSAVEVTTSTGDVSIFGELSTSAYVNVRQIATDTIREIGYNKAELGFTADRKSTRQTPSPCNLKCRHKLEKK